MADVKKMATRDGYGKALVELGKEHADIVVLDADLAGSTKTGMFAKAYPDRHFNCGIAEADMMCVAAGLAASGMTPFASSFAMFASGRAYEQIRNSIGYTRLNVKIGASHGGLSVGEDGASHQCCEDFALMRSIPGMVVICPADGVEAEAATKAAYEYKGPVYLRMGRLAVPVFHEEGFEFQIGKGEVMRDGDDIAIIANGLMVYEAIQAGDLGDMIGLVKFCAMDGCTVGPLDFNALGLGKNLLVKNDEDGERIARNIGTGGDAAGRRSWRAGGRRFNTLVYTVATRKRRKDNGHKHK